MTDATTYSATLGNPHDLTRALTECQAARGLAKTIHHIATDDLAEANTAATATIGHLDAARGFAATIANLVDKGHLEAAGRIGGVIQHLDQAIAALAMLDDLDLDRDASDPGDDDAGDDADASDGPWHDDPWADPPAGDNQDEQPVNSKRVVLTIPIWRTAPPEHAGRSPCLCDDCWRAYLNWCDRHEPEPAAVNGCCGAVRGSECHCGTCHVTYTGLTLFDAPPGRRLQPRPGHHLPVTGERAA
jgi:hypothetical protein